MHKKHHKIEKGYINMKRKVTLVLALAMILSLSACGSETETAEATAPETEITTATDETADETQADTESEATTEETIAETEAEAVVHADIEEASPCYYGGVMFKTAENEFYYYRFSDKKMFDLSENEFYSEYVDSVCVSGSIARLVNKIVNIDTNEVLYDLSDGTASLCNTGYFGNRYWGDKGALAIKSTSQSFDSDNSTIVALRNDGTVIGELPDEDTFAAIVINDRYMEITASDGYSYLYDLTTGNKLAIKAAGRFTDFPLDADNHIYYIDSEGNGACYDKNNDSNNVMLSATDYSYICTCENETVSNHMNIYGFDKNSGKLSVIDTASNDIVDFDISSFTNKCDSDVHPYMACATYAFVGGNKSNVHYVAMLDKDGNTFFDPIAISNNEKIYYSENYFVCCDGENSFVVDTNTKAVTYPSDGLSIESYDTMGSDVLLVKDSDGNYFLANAATPNDLYSPFDDYVQ